MSDSFFSRWARRKTEHAKNEGSDESANLVRTSEAHANSSLANAEHSSKAVQPDLPSMKDVASLAPDSDYSAFLAKGVDKAVRRAAMKKLFSDPHFNVMDGLDIYIDDYNKPSPLPPGMLDALQHARSTLEPKPLYKTQEEEGGEQQSIGQGVEGDAPSVADEMRSDTEASDDAQAREHENQGEEDTSTLQAGTQNLTGKEALPRPSHATPYNTPIHSIEFPPT